MTDGLDELKQRQRAAWAAGDYPNLATTIEPVSEAVVEAAGVAEGDSVLDVATGTGNAALAAARRGARVTGIDFTPGLLEVGRRRADEEGLTIDLAEGDAEHLEFDDDSFDHVISVFGTMFAPDQERAAGELLRVSRPGGTIAVAAWTPSGLNGQLFAAVGAQMPPPPEGFKPPVLWGDERAIRELFVGAAEVRCELRHAHGAVRSDSMEEWLDYIERALGPLELAKRALEPEGRWEAVRADLADLYERFNGADDGSVSADPEYLLTTTRGAAMWRGSPTLAPCPTNPT